MTLKNQLSIRRARPVDDIRCGQIIAAAWMASELPVRLPHAVAMFDDGAPLPVQGRQRRVAEIGDFIAGFVDLDIAHRHVWHLFVEPDLQGNGIGGALLDAAQMIAGGPLSLQCLEAGRASLRFYRAQGFQAVGRHRAPLSGRPVSWVRLRRRSKRV